MSHNESCVNNHGNYLGLYISDDRVSVLINAGTRFCYALPFYKYLICLQDTTCYIILIVTIYCSRGYLINGGDNDGNGEEGDDDGGGDCGARLTEEVTQ